MQRTGEHLPQKRGALEAAEDVLDALDGEADDEAE